MKFNVMHYRLFFGVVGLLGLVLMFGKASLDNVDERSLSFAFLKTGSYFTVQTNIMVTLWFFLAVLYRGEKKHWIFNPRLRGALTVYITGTFIGFAVLIHPRWNPQGVDLITACITHYVMPLAMMIDWLYAQRQWMHQWRDLLFWSIYPLFYIVYEISFNYWSGVKLYYFMDLAKNSVLQLTVNVTALFMLFLLIGVLYVAFNRRTPSAVAVKASDS